MQVIYLLLLALAVAHTAQARYVVFNDPNNPVRFILTSNGQGNHERVEYLYAEIYPRHVTNQRTDFPSSGPLNRYFTEARAPGDERGHLVGSQFSGPIDWYNLSPQNARVNRNVGYRAITTDWYGTECEVRRWLDRGGNRYVRWAVDMTYVQNSNRPDTYRLMVEFVENNRTTGSSIDTTIRNPFLREDSTFWICRSCGNNNSGGSSSSSSSNSRPTPNRDELRRRDADTCKRQ